MLPRRRPRHSRSCRRRRCSQGRPPGFTPINRMGCLRRRLRSAHRAHLLEQRDDRHGLRARGPLDFKAPAIQGIRQPLVGDGRNGVATGQAGEGHGEGRGLGHGGDRHEAAGRLTVADEVEAPAARRGVSEQFLQQSIQLRQFRSRHVLHLTAMQVENRLIELGEQVYAHGGDLHDDTAAVFGRPKKRKQVTASPVPRAQGHDKRPSGRYTFRASGRETGAGE